MAQRIFEKIVLNELCDLPELTQKSLILKTRGILFLLNGELQLRVTYFAKVT